MLEAAEDTEVPLFLDTVEPDADPAAAEDIRALLASLGLDMDPDVEVFVTGRQQGKLVGCLGLSGCVVKCLGCDEHTQGAGLSTRLMQRMNDEAADRGRHHLFAFTRPRNRRILEQLGFYYLAEVPGSAVLLENTPFGLSSYLAMLRSQRLPGARIGSIVMNANPFTLGHRYLVEQALTQVDGLHVFVVSEEAARFPADVRLRLVREGIAALGAADRIRVHPGGQHIVSRATFPNYFIKDAQGRARAAAGLDLQLFRNRIAPTLGITDRFVGTEPLSPVTADYNAEMRHWLSEVVADAAPIAVHVLDRLVLDGEVVSASRVRAALDAGDLRTLRRLTPDPTYAYLKAHYFPEPRS